MTNLSIFHAELSIDSTFAGVSPEQLAGRFLHFYSVVSGIPLRKIESQVLDTSGENRLDLEIRFKRVQFRRQYAATLISRLWRHYFNLQSYDNWKPIYLSNPSVACAKLRENFQRGEVFRKFYERRKQENGGYDIFLDTPVTDPNHRIGMGGANVQVVRNGIHCKPNFDEYNTLVQTQLAVVQ
jgi:hypothetical protein